MDRRSTTGYCVLIERNIIFWKSKKQNEVVRSSAQAKYKVMESLTCKLVWVKQFIQ